MAEQALLCAFGEVLGYFCISTIMYSASYKQEIELAGVFGKVEQAANVNFHSVLYVVVLE